MTYDLTQPFPAPAPCPDCNATRVPMWCSTDMALMRGWPGKGMYSKVSTLIAVACTGCGRTTLYAKDPAKVREAVEKHPRDFQW
jgi:hypothetical protein